MSGTYRKLEKLSDLDDLIYQRNDNFFHSPDEIRTLRTKYILESFKHHLVKNEKYKVYAETLGVNIEEIQSDKELHNIPLIPSKLFKVQKITGIKDEEVAKVCTSSGTKGSISKVYRDEVTLERFLGGMQNIIDSLLELDDAYCVNLGPDTEEAGDLWFSYVMSLISMIFPTSNLVKEGNFYPDEAVKEIKNSILKYENIVIVGAPAMFLELFQYMKKSDQVVHGCNNILCLTAGGWKRAQGQALSRKELFCELESVFHGIKSENFRDILNMVELNSIFCECHKHKKHVPIWTKIIVLDPITLMPVPDGEEGILAFLDSSAESYPAFVLTDDIAKMESCKKCKCGRTSDIVDIVRRVKDNDARGCALKIDAKYCKKEGYND